MADRTAADLAARLREWHATATANGAEPVVPLYDDLAAAARLLVEQAEQVDRLRQLAGFLIDACATHRIDVPIHSSLLGLAADIAGGGVPEEGATDEQ